MARKLHNRCLENLRAFFEVPAVPEDACHVEHRHRIAGVEDKRFATVSDRFVGPAQMVERPRNLKPAHRVGMGMDVTLPEVQSAARGPNRRPAEGGDLPRAPRPDPQLTIRVSKQRIDRAEGFAILSKVKERIDWPSG